MPPHVQPDLLAKLKWATLALAGHLRPTLKSCFKTKLIIPSPKPTSYSTLSYSDSIFLFFTQA